MVNAALALGLAAVPLAMAADEVGRVGTVDTPYAPAFLQVTSDKQLYASTFFNIALKPLGGIKDAVHLYDIDDTEFKGGFDASKGTVVVEQRWPNEVVETMDVFTYEDGSKLKGLSVAGGFLPPQQKGVMMGVVEFESEHFYFQLSPSHAGIFGPRWFYHRGLWVDMDGDGDLDLLTARSDWNVPPSVLRFYGQLVWFENPGNMVLTADMVDEARTRSINNLSSKWTRWVEHVIDNGNDMGSGDVMVRLHDFEGDGKMEIVTTHFFLNDAGLSPFDKDPGPGVVVYALKDGVDNWGEAAYPAEVDRVTAASGFGQPFDIEFHDMNGDGKVDLLSTNHEEDGDEALVVVLEIPEGAAWRTEEWTRHDIAKGFPNRLNNGMSPGAAQYVHPTAAHEAAGNKPWVLVSGDGSGDVHILVPKSEDASDWEYERLLVYDTAVDNDGEAKTTGAIAVSKLDPACHSIYVPSYEAFQILVFNLCEIADSLPALREQTTAYLARMPAKSSSEPAQEQPAAVDTTSAMLAPMLGLGGAALVAVGAAFFVGKRFGARREGESQPAGAMATNPTFDSKV